MLVSKHIKIRPVVIQEFDRYIHARHEVHQLWSSSMTRVRRFRSRIVKEIRSFCLSALLISVRCMSIRMRNVSIELLTQLLGGQHG